MPWITLNWKSLMREMTFASLLIRCLTSEMNDFNHSLKGGLFDLWNAQHNKLYICSDIVSYSWWG